MRKVALKVRNSVEDRSMYVVIGRADFLVPPTLQGARRFSQEIRRTFLVGHAGGGYADARPDDLQHAAVGALDLLDDGFVAGLSVARITGHLRLPPGSGSQQSGSERCAPVCADIRSSPVHTAGRALLGPAASPARGRQSSRSSPF